MYDSESSRVEQGFSESSELDSSRKVQPNNAQLKEQNEELMKENTVLRSQFEDAIKVTKQLELVHSQNNDLLQQVRSLRKERDDLEHRLEISLDTIKEMNSKLNEEKRSCSTIRGTDLTSMTKEIEKVKAQSKAQLDSVYDQLEKAKQATERENVEKRLLASKLDHILEDAKRSQLSMISSHSFQHHHQSKIHQHQLQERELASSQVLQKETIQLHLKRRSSTSSKR